MPRRAMSGERQGAGGEAPRPSRLATAAAWLGCVCVALAIAGPVIQGAVRSAGIWPRAEFHYLFLWGVACGPVASLLGIMALRATRPSAGKLGRGRAWLGCVSGLALTAALVAFAWAPH